MSLTNASLRCVQLSADVKVLLRDSAAVEAEYNAILDFADLAELHEIYIPARDLALRRIIAQARPVGLRNLDVSYNQRIEESEILRLYELTPAVRKLRLMFLAEEEPKNIPPDLLPQLQSLSLSFNRHRLEGYILKRPVHDVEVSFYTWDSQDLEVQELVTVILPLSAAPIRSLGLLMDYSWDSMKALDGTLPALRQLNLNFFIGEAVNLMESTLRYVSCPRALKLEQQEFPTLGISLPELRVLELTMNLPKDRNIDLREWEYGVISKWVVTNCQLLNRMVVTYYGLRAPSGRDWRRVGKDEWRSGEITWDVQVSLEVGLH